MAGTFSPGESKIRPGIYFRTENSDAGTTAQRGGVVAAVFKGDWGPLGQVVTLSAASEIDQVFGPALAGSTLEALKLAFQGGAIQVKAVRLGAGGTKATATLNVGESGGTITLTAAYEGARPLAVTVKDYVGDPDTLRECSITSESAILGKVIFAKGGDEAAALLAALAENPSLPVTASASEGASGTITTAAQTAFTGGTSPTVNVSAYSSAFTLLEAAQWDVLCVDSVEADIHALVQAFVSRSAQSGRLGIAVIGENVSSDFYTRKAHCKAFNDPAIVYCINGAADSAGTVYDGWKIAALVAGLIAATPSSSSLTHKTIPGMDAVYGALANEDIEECLRCGALVVSASSKGVPWIEQGINTLNALSSDQDEGWKKIRRVRTRYELITRCNQATESIIGTVNNDANGRATVIAAANGIIKEMVAEGKLVSGSIVEDSGYSPTPDSAWFIIQVVDLDSIEKIYLRYQFRFGG